MHLKSENKINLFLIGPGLVGSALLRMLNDRKDYLQERFNIVVSVTGLMNSKKMIFDDNGINISEWKNELEAKGEKSQLDLFLDKVKCSRLPNTILADCTATGEVVPYYPDILSSGIPIVTPNKTANTQSYDKYLSIREAERKGNSVFRYGTNAGSALPFISTLKDIVANGDEVYKIEGIFSGTLSFIFNSLKEKDSFSSIVRTAKELGYTEPDPRDDLGGKDMARKLLILMRECGYKYEMEDITIEKLISPEAQAAPTVEEFFNYLENDDNRYVDLKKKAKENNSVIVYTAKYEEGKAGLSLKMIDSGHPFSNLTNSENIVAFTTKNYFRNPLILRGQGAGADFTASGIITDILRIYNRNR